MEIFTQYFDGVTVQYHIATASIIVAAIACLLTLLFGLGRYDVLIPTLLLPAGVGLMLHMLGYVLANGAHRFWDIPHPDFLPYVGPLTAAALYTLVVGAIFVGMRRSIHKAEQDASVRREL